MNCLKYANGVIYNLGYHAVNGATTDLQAEFGPKRFLRDLDVFDRGIRSDQMAIFFRYKSSPQNHVLGACLGTQQLF